MSLDKTTKTGQDNSAAAPGESSGSKGGSTSKDKGKLYTDAAITKIKSDAAAEAGRLRKAAESERDTLKQDLEAITGRFNVLEGEIRESRLAEARGDPAALQLFNREEALKRGERELESGRRDLARDGEQLKSDRVAVDADKGVMSIAYLAAKYGLKPERLEKFSNLDSEALEAVAEELATTKPTGADEGGKGFVPDSGETTGDRGFTLDKLSPDELIKEGLKEQNK